MHEIIPGLWLGCMEASRDNEFLKQHGITHMITAMRVYLDAKGELIWNATTEPDRFSDPSTGISRLCIPVHDTNEENLLQHLRETTDFIHEALSSGGKILVHCQVGYSRSPAVVAAYLMETYELGHIEALAEIKKVRNVSPRKGFYNQLYIFGFCGYRPSNHPAYKHWNSQRIKFGINIDNGGGTATVEEDTLFSYGKFSCRDSGGCLSNAMYSFT